MRLLRIMAAALLGLGAGGAWAAEAKPLPPPHAAAKLTCHDCHQKEKPLAAAVPDQACMVCHGDYPAMKALTKDAKPNPHAAPQASPHEPYPCTDCHRQHKPPVVKCLECHEGRFTFKIK